MTPLAASVATGSHLFWLVSRAAGTAALLTSSAGVCVGLSMSARWVTRRGADLRIAHEALSLATMAALVVHALSLLGDAYLHPTLADVAVPFVSGYREPWMAIGILAGWAMIVLGLSYYVRARIGVARWRLLHRFTALAWVAGVVHTVGEGTDAGTAWYLVLTGVVVLPATVLLIARLVPRRSADPQRPRRPARGTTRSMAS